VASASRCRWNPDLKAQYNEPGPESWISRSSIPRAPRTGLRGHAHRGLLGLKDNVFIGSPLDKVPSAGGVFYGRGWGHGLGMCQPGAYGMALEGATFSRSSSTTIPA